MKRVLWQIAVVAAVYGLAVPAMADTMNLKVNQQGMNMKVQTDDGSADTRMHTSNTSSESGDNYTLSYTGHPQGRTLLKIMAPDGLGATVSKGSMQVARDEIPFTYKAQNDVFYKITVQCPGKAWSKKIEAKTGMIAVLKVSCPGVQMKQAPGQMNINLTVNEPAARPQMQAKPQPVANAAMSGSDFNRLVNAIKSEDFSDGKLSILKEAAAHKYFTSEQSGKILDLFEFENDKVKAGAICHKRVVDPDNWYTVYSHFEFDASKNELRKAIKKQ